MNSGTGVTLGPTARRRALTHTAADAAEWCLRPPRTCVLKSHGSRMKLQHPHDCSCHAAEGPHGARGVSGSPSTGYFVLGLSVLLVVCGLLQTGVLKFW